MAANYVNFLLNDSTPRTYAASRSHYIRRCSQSAKKDELTASNLNVSAYGSPILDTRILLDATEDITEGLVTEDDVNQQVSGMFQEFLDLYLSYPGKHEVFDLVLRFEEVCSRNVEYLWNIVKKAPIQNKLNTLNILLSNLCHERNTWRMLRILYADKIERDNFDEDCLMDVVGKRMSDKQLIDNLFLRDGFVRKCQLVVDCLEKNASDDFQHTHFDKLEYFSDHSVPWEHTLHNLTTSSIMGRPTRDNLITELDPDAPIRQKNNVLHDADKEDEARLLKYMFICMRAGDLDKAQRMAEKFGHLCLAASLEGWRLYHDPNYDNENVLENGMLQPIEGNKYRDIWKLACWKMSEVLRTTVYQQAMYGSLCGNLKAVLRACENWEDYLWAYLRALIDRHTEQELRSNTQTERELVELPAEYWDKILSLEQIFQELQACPSELVRKESQGCYQIIQKYIILDDVDGLIEECYNWSQKDPPILFHLLRIITHVVLFLREIGHPTKENLCVSIIEAYIQQLIDQRKIALVAAYTATLPPAHQVVWYAKFLEGITDPTERQLCRRYAEESGLDIALITKTVVENMRARLPSVEEPSALCVTVTTEEDKQKIEAIDWLIFDQTQRAEALRQANALMRVFVASGKLDAARQVFAKIPMDSINVIMSLMKLKGRTELTAEEDNSTREYLCFKAYLEAMDAFNDWFQHFQHSKPKCPEPPAGVNVKFKDKVAHEHEMKQYELELERWEHCLMAQTKTTTDHLYNVLLFVNGGWMVDQRMDDDEADESRKKQMMLLRKLCIPQITSLLHSLLYNTHQYKESVQLADIITSEKHQLYKEFSVSEVQQLFSSLRESSLALLSENMDALGYAFH